MLLSNCHIKFIFPLAFTVEGSALRLTFFHFHYACCFTMPEKILVFKHIILFQKIKLGEEIERVYRIFFRGFLGLVNGPKTSILNWASNLNVENNFFFYYLKTYLSFFCLQSLEKIRFNLLRVGCLIAKSPHLLPNVSHLLQYKRSLLQNTAYMSNACKPYLQLRFTGFSSVFTGK